MVRSTFILDAACWEAENVLLDQRLFYLDEKYFEALEAVLIAPMPDNTRLKALLAKPSPWE